MSELGAIRDAVTEYFDRRPNVPTRRWDQFAPAEHALGFTVARSAGFDILEDIRTEIRKAIRDGLPFDQFRSALEPALKAKGWWGDRQRFDPDTGREVTERLGSPRRLRLIYDANIRSAQAAGEWVDIQANKAFLPYLEYITSLSERKRPEHLAWVGTTLPVDDPWWRTHYPPNGWNCKCRVRPRAEPRDDLTPAQLRRPPLDLQPWRSASTGESRLAPRGIDPGWDGNAGLARSRLAGRQMTDRLDAMVDDTARREAIARLRQDPALRYIVENGAGYDPKAQADHALRHLRWPVAALPAETAERLGTRSRTVAITVATAEKQMRQRRPPLSVADYDNVQLILDNPVGSIDDGDLSLWGRIDGAVWKAAIKVTSADEVLVTSLRLDAEANIGTMAGKRRQGLEEKRRSEGR